MTMRNLKAKLISMTKIDAASIADANVSTKKKTVKNEQPLKLKYCLNIRKNLFIKWLYKF